jgi:hypothetical protein
MHFSGLVLVGAVHDQHIDDDDDDNEATELAVALFPVKLEWGSRSAPTHPKLRKKEDAIKFILNEQFSTDFWRHRHKETVLVLGTYEKHDRIEINTVIDIKDCYQFAWQ